MVHPTRQFKMDNYLRSESLQNKLLNEKILTNDQLQVVLAEKKSSKKSFIQLLTELGFISGEEIKAFLTESYQLYPFSLKNLVINPSLLKAFPREMAEAYQIFPFHHSAEGLHVALVDINDLEAYDKLRECFDESSVIPYIATTEEILQAIEQTYGQLNFLNKVLKEFEAFANDTFVSNEDALPIRFIDAVILDAVKGCVSDIHFEPKEAYLSIRFRLDGILQERCVVHVQHWPALLTRLKILSGMNIAESRLPQVGRFSTKVSGRAIDFRSSSHPTHHGESFVLRVLDKFHALLSLEDLGFFREQIALLKQQIQRPEGLIILTGPTGSGKTTTLYSMLSYLSSKELNIMTLEDPIEYELPGVRQTQVDEFIGLTFVEGARSILRQDPDVVLIGEIRDEPTAKMALRAAMTGHLVLTTLHTNNALGAVNRLIDLGIPAPLLSGNINCIVAQRLLRRLCPSCKAPSLSQAYKAVGCSSCHQKGYQGRIAVAEILQVDTHMDELLITQRSHHTLMEEAILKGFETFVSNSKRLIQEGLTSLEEAKRVIYIDQEVKNATPHVSL